MNSTTNTTTSHVTTELTAKRLKWRKIKNGFRLFLGSVFLFAFFMALGLHEDPVEAASGSGALAIYLPGFIGTAFVMWAAIDETVLGWQIWWNHD